MPDALSTAKKMQVFGSGASAGALAHEYVWALSPLSLALGVKAQKGADRGEPRPCHGITIGEATGTLASLLSRPRAALWSGAWKRNDRSWANRMRGAPHKPPSRVNTRVLQSHVMVATAAQSQRAQGDGFCNS